LCQKPDRAALAFSEGDAIAAVCYIGLLSDVKDSGDLSLTLFL
jgi:hypothetical protein